MRAFLSIWIYLCSALIVWAQDDQPQLEVIFEDTEAIPGQPLTLRLTVLVPTFMPEPPVWPDFESPNLMVRLPAKASSPTSKTIGGETWSGISRRYQVTPVVPGTFEIPAGEVRVRYRAREGSDLLEATLPVPAQKVTGVLPEGAEDLDPFVAANKITLKQSLEGETTGLVAGDSFTRVLQAQIEGVSPMFLPTLTPEIGLPRLRAYPESPVFEEQENRGLITGIRREKVVYLIEGGVDGALPDIRLKWFNLKSGQVEEAVLDAIPVQADAPVLSAPNNQLDVDSILRWGVYALIALGALSIVLRIGAPWVLRAAKTLRTTFRASAAFAYRDLRRALHRDDLHAIKRAYQLWSKRLPKARPEIEAAITEAFLDLGAAQYGKASTGDTLQARIRLRSLCHIKRRETRYRRSQNTIGLPPLNPVSTQNH